MLIINLKRVSFLAAPRNLTILTIPAPKWEVKHRGYKYITVGPRGLSDAIAISEWSKHGEKQGRFWRFEKAIHIVQ